VATHPSAAHPDSWKYFARCVPADEPVPAVFEGDGPPQPPSEATPPPDSGGRRAALWARPGTPYHGTLPVGDNSLTARLAALVAAGVAADGGFDAEAYFRRYLMLLAGAADGPALAARFLGGNTGVPPAPPAAMPSTSDATAAAAAASPAAVAAALDPAVPRGLASHNHDTWVDEGHRVLLRNMARAGAAPWEAGLDDCCLTGIALATPLLLAYAGNRDAQEAAVRALLQLTHKTEDMVRQVLMFGDVLALLLANAAAAAAAGGATSTDSATPTLPPPRTHDVPTALTAVCASYSDGRVHLPEVAARFAAHPPDTAAGPGDPAAADAPAFHGPAALFSVR
jgi:hypothetical protein